MLNFLFLSLIREMVEMVEVLCTKFNISYVNPHLKRQGLPIMHNYAKFICDTVPKMIYLVKQICQGTALYLS
jgi:hypothetical protein